MTRSNGADPIPLSESMAGGREFAKGYAEGGYLANASSAGVPGVVAALVLLPIAWLGARLLRAVRRR